MSVRFRERSGILAVHFHVPRTREALLILSFGKESATFGDFIPPGAWKRVLDSAEPKWGGNGVVTPATLPADEAMAAPRSAALYVI